MSAKTETKPKAASPPGPAKQARKQNRPFPAHAFEEALQFAQAIQNSSGSQPIRRLTLFDEIGKSPESSASRTLITSASKYGLIKGGHKSETIELTDLGISAMRLTSRLFNLSALRIKYPLIFSKVAR